MCLSPAPITYGSHFSVGQKPVEIHRKNSAHMNQHDYVMLLVVGKSRKTMILHILLSVGSFT